MGALCSCCFPEEDNQRNPLLTSGGQDKRYDGNAHTSPTTSQPEPARSARQYAVSEETQQREFLSSLQQVDKVVVEDLPSKLAEMEKTLKDHAKLYNEQYEAFEDLRKCLDKFKRHFIVETAGIPDVKSCLDILADRCGEAKLIAKRQSKNCIEIEFDRREVSEHCQGPPEDVLEQLELYNKMNRLIKSLLSKVPAVHQSLKMVMEAEEEHIRTVFKQYSTAEGPEAIKQVKVQLNRLRKAPEHLETIKKYTEKIWNEILQGSQALFLDEEEKQKKRKEKKESEKRERQEREEEVE